MKKIQKKQLIKMPIAKETQMLAEVIYNTYLTNEQDPYMLICVEKFYELFHLEDSSASLEWIVEVFIDLTEPIFIEEFEFQTQTYTNIILTFCTFKLMKQEDAIFLEIELNEMYLEALRRYIVTPYLKIE